MAFRDIGSIWGKWDLHFHTPASFDYKNKSVTNQQIIDALKKAGVEVVAITDHHTMDVARIQELQKLGKDQLTVLPGIELRSELGGKEHVHYIGIFPEDANIADLWTKLSGKLGITSLDVQKKGNEKIYVSFERGAACIHELGGIVTVHAGRKSNSIEQIGNAEDFKRAFKTDIVEKYINILEVGREADQKDYIDKVFPAIDRKLPLIIGSDNHDIRRYESKAVCWIKGDLSFRTFQQLLSDPDRAYIGGKPPEKARVEANSTKYIKNISLKKVSGSKLKEEWFDNMVPINPGFVAIIGNKGSGKTALAETMGLLGNCETSDSFSFLSSNRFRQPRSNKAQEFAATLTWLDGHEVTKKLSDSTDATMTRDVSYIPQSYLETICNEVDGDHRSQFDSEIKAVIFSHVPTHKKLGKESLDKLILFKTEQIKERIAASRGELHKINEQILDLEDQSSPKNREGLDKLKEAKQREIEAHDKQKPTEVSKPETDPAKQAAMQEITRKIENIKKNQETQRDTVQASEDGKKKAAAQIASAERAAQLLENFEKAYQSLLHSLEEDCKILEIDVTKLTTVRVDQSLVTEGKNAAEKHLRDEEDKGAEASKKLNELNVQLNSLTAELDAPNRDYQKYTEALRSWTQHRAKLIGDVTTPETLSYLEAQIEELNHLPSRLADTRAKRDERVKEIFNQIEAVVGVYRELYHPVQEFMLRDTAAKDQFHLEFDATITASGWEDVILSKVNQGRKGSFCGVAEGKHTLKSLIEQADLQSPGGSAKFCGDLLTRFESDFRSEVHVSYSLTDQLRAGVTPVLLLDAIFGLEYLVPKYHLKWAGKNIEELSPGERGMLLLVFYFLIDRRDIPLIIDQPEDNLDNQTVHDMLAACLRTARKRRQVIIVTHNPNLAVASDADQIIYSQIDKLNDRNKVTYTSGSIENPETNHFCMAVLEGTRPAFVHREYKYQRES